MAIQNETTWNVLLLAHALRTNPVYRAAEERRRTVGALRMAEADPASTDCVGVRLLTDSWVKIAQAVSADGPSMDFNFQRLPLTLVWTTLQPAIGVFRKADPGYASALKDLLEPYGAFLLNNPQYASEGGQAVNALFG